MTRGYYVLEQGKTIVKAAYLSGDAYLQGGYGEQIIKSYTENHELDLLERLASETNKEDVEYIRPEWYRKTGHSEKNDMYYDYAYVLTGNHLKVYYYGHLMFVVTKETASYWAEYVSRQDEVERHYLYNEEALNYDFSRKAMKKMYKELTVKAEHEESLGELPESDFSCFQLSDEHLIDVWHRTDRPAYQKYLCWEGHNKGIRFIVQMEPFSHRWSTCIQLPYIRKQILTENTSEKKCMEQLRNHIRTFPESYKNFILISECYDQILEKISDSIDLEDLLGEIEKVKREFLDKNWICGDHKNGTFSIGCIRANLLTAWERKNNKKDVTA